MTGPARIHTGNGGLWSSSGISSEEKEIRCALPCWFDITPKENSGQSDVCYRYRRPWSYLLALGILGAHCLLAATASVTGSIVDDGGRPVAGARVLISYAPATKSPVPAPPMITGPLATMVAADASGVFHADGLAPGQYIGCAETLTPGYLDPCHWSATAPNFTVSAGQTTSGVKIIMAKGSVLRVHVADPQQLLKAVAGPVDLDLEIHIVTSKGIHYSAPIQSSTALGRDHAITVPFDTSVSLRILSAHLAVTDESGKSFAPLGTTVNVPAATGPAVIQLTVTGKK
jgi:hypothetical protein